MNVRARDPWLGWLAMGAFVFLSVAGCAPAGPASAEEVSPAEEQAQESDPIARYLTAAVPDSAEVRVALEQLDEGIRRWRDRERTRGVELVDQALARLPTAADWRPLVRAELLAASGDTAGVRRALDQLDPETGLFARFGWRFGVQAFIEAGDPAGARAYVGRVASSHMDGESAHLARLRLGELALSQRDTTAALATFRQVLTQSQIASTRSSAARRVDALARSASLEEQVTIGEALLAGGEWERAVNRLRPLLESPQLSEVRQSELRLGVGQAQVELNRHRDALVTLAPLTGDLTPNEKAVQALYWTGRARLGLGEVASAEESFRRIRERSPYSALVEDGMLRILDQEMERASPTRAAQLVNSLFEAGVSLPASELHAVRFAAGRYLAGDYPAAVQSFEAYLSGSRRGATRQQAAYWAGLAHDRAGDRVQAQLRLQEAYDEDPLTFYGVFAGERLGAPVLSELLTLGPEPVVRLEPELANALIRLRIHQIVPTSGSFVLELERLTRHFQHRGSGVYDFAEALIEGGFPMQGIVLGRDIRRDEGEWNVRLLRIVHPMPHREVIVAESRARGLDPFFVAGLIRQESMFHTSIRSSAGAIGLMQLMPGTAREVAQAAGIRYSEAALSDPAVNVRLGTAYLATMIQRFDGRAEDALAAYNAGPTRIRQWRQRPEYRDRDVFMESIPFRETRHYVKVVQQYTRIYTALYGCGDFQPCLGLSYPSAVARSPFAGGAPGTAVAR